MRVIAGIYKSRVLKDFNNPNTRPTLDRVKEAIFSKLHFYCQDAVVLDLFSGTGALGIEALSRGAKQVHFVDKNKTAYNLIKHNLQSLNATQNTAVHNCDFITALENFKQNNITFDMVLLDPPFRKELAKQAIQKLLELNLLNDNGIIMLECANEEETAKFSQLTNIEEKKYGTVKVIYYMK